jgi:hypothetical protein
MQTILDTVQGHSSSPAPARVPAAARI